MDPTKFELDIQTKGDFKAARELKTILEDEVKVLKRLGQDASEAEARLKKTQEVMKAVAAHGQVKTGSPLSGLLGGLKDQGANVLGSLKSGAVSSAIGLLGAVSAGFTAVAGAAAGAAANVHEWATAQERVTMMDAALAQQGQLTDENREKYQALTSQLQKLTSIADEEWASVLARLTQFGSDPRSIGMDADAVKNLAGIMNGDLQTAALMVGKALQGNFTAFGRLGISVDQNASQTKKLEQLYRELASRGGGQLEARAKTLGGQWRGMKLALSDLMESFGSTIANTGLVQNALSFLTDGFAKLAEEIGAVYPRLQGLQNAEEKTIDTQEELEASAKRYEKRLAGMKLEADRFADALARVRNESEAIRRRQDEQNNARMALELAIVDDQERRGVIKAPTAVARRAAVREKYELLKEAAQLKNDLKQIQVNADELKAAQMREAQTKAEIASLERRKKIAAEYGGGTRAEMNREISRIEAEMGNTLPKPEDGPGKTRAQLGAEYRDYHRRENERKADVKRRADDLRRRRDLFWPAGPENQAVLDADLQRARERLKDDSVTADKASRTLPEQNRQIVEDAKSRASVSGYGAMTDRVKGESASQLLAAAAKAASASGELNASLTQSFQQIVANHEELIRQNRLLLSRLKNASGR